MPPKFFLSIVVLLTPSLLWGQVPDRDGRSSKVNRRIAITIDDGPSSGAGDDLEMYQRITDGIREAFVRNKVPAIMFINENQLNVGGQRDSRVRSLETWLDAGLELGNHTYSHRRPDEAELHRYFDDVVQGEVVTRKLLSDRGQSLVWYRYPYLATGRGNLAQQIEDFLTMRGYRIAPVTIDYKDYSFATDYSRLLRAGEKAKAQERVAEMWRALDTAFERSEKESMRIVNYEIRQILLIHCNLMNAITLDETLKRIRDRGYEFISLQEAMQDPVYQSDFAPGVMGGGAILYAVEEQGANNAGK